MNKSLAGEGKIRKSFEPHIRNNYVHRYKSTVVWRDKHIEGDPGSPLRVVVVGGGCPQPCLLQEMMVGLSGAL